MFQMYFAPGLALLGDGGYSQLAAVVAIAMVATKVSSINRSKTKTTPTHYNREPWVGVKSKQQLNI